MVRTTERAADACLVA